MKLNKDLFEGKAPLSLLNHSNKIALILIKTLRSNKSVSFFMVKLEGFANLDQLTH